MDVSLYIAVPVFNRVAIADHCLPTLRDSMLTQDHLAIYDDGSVEDASRLAAFADTFHRSPANIGVNAQRRNHILDFVSSGRDFLYFTDADAIHSPAWRSRLLELHERTGYLTCGYHTQTHEAYTNNVYARKGDYLLSRFAPGVSMLLSRKQAELIAGHLPDRWDFDWAIPAMLGYKCAVTEDSVVDHISRSGMHHDGSPGYNGGDRALNPTEWLVKKRAEIVAELTKSP
jgi:glycosyltransferase involved in cell wall biosynthesis